MDFALVTSVAVAATAVILFWAWRRIECLNAADYYGQRFTSAAKNLLSNDAVPMEAKGVIRELAPYINEAFVAQAMILLFSKRQRAKSGVLRDNYAVAVAKFNDDDLKMEFLRTLALYFYALSYLDPKDGWRLRRHLSTHETRAVKVYARSAKLALQTSLEFKAA